MVESRTEYKINSMGRRYDPNTGRFLRMPITMEQFHQKLDNEIRMWRGPVRLHYMTWKIQKDFAPVESTWEAGIDKIKEDWEKRPQPSEEHVKFLNAWKVEKEQEEQRRILAESRKGEQRWWERLKEKVSGVKIPRLVPETGLGRLRLAGALAVMIGAAAVVVRDAPVMARVNNEPVRCDIEDPELTKISICKRADGDPFWNLAGWSIDMEAPRSDRVRYNAEFQNKANRTREVAKLLDHYARRNNQSVSSYRPGEVLEYSRVITAQERQVFKELRDIPLSDQQRFNDVVRRAYGN